MLQEPRVRNGGFWSTSPKDTMPAKVCERGRLCSDTVHYRPLHPVHHRVELVHQHCGIGIEYYSIFETDRDQLLHMVIRSSQNGLFSQICHIPIISRLHNNRRFRAASLEGKWNSESDACSEKEEVA